MNKVNQTAFKKRIQSFFKPKASQFMLFNKLIRIQIFAKVGKSDRLLNK
jgi:hypothetical protein